MEKGIYITANNKVMDHAIACLNSIRLYDPDIPIMLIPYDDNYQEIAQKLKGTSKNSQGDLTMRS